MKRLRSGAGRRGPRKRSSRSGGKGPPRLIMKPAAFDYYRPQSLDEALSLLAQYAGDAKPLAGGQSLIPAMNFRLATPAVLVDLNGVGELAYIKEAADGLRIGAM